jgi:hypothetical protein
MDEIMLTRIRNAIPFLEFILTAALSSAPFISVPAAAAQSSSGPALTLSVPANDVSFSLSMEKSTYGTREKIPVNYRIENIGKGRLYVPLGFERTGCLRLGPPHIRGGFENSAGQHFVPGYGVSCGSTPGVFPAITERMVKGTALLQPGEHIDGILQLDPTMFGGLPSGSYRIEVTLRGWKNDEFTSAELDELAKLGNPFLQDEVTASASISLTP